LRILNVMKLMAPVAALVLVACANAPGVSMASISGPAADAPVAAEDAHSQGYGDYLAGRLAATQHDMRDAAKFYQASLDDDPDNPQLLERAFLYTASAGDLDKAADYAKRVVELEKDNRAARLVLAITDIRHGDYSGARKQLAQSAGGPFTSLTISLLDAWASVGAGNSAAALDDLAKLKDQGGTDALAAYHRALIFDLEGKSDAEAAYRDALAAAGASPRIVDAYGRFLERAGRADEAKKLYDQLNSKNSLHPLAAEAGARIAAGQKPDRLIQTPGEGAAEALFGIAASLTDATSADVAILYLRMALYLQPDFDLAKILLADRFEALEKWQDAIDTYRSFDKSSPYYRIAAIQGATDETKVGKTDDAIATLTELTSAHPDDIDAWTALGDVWRSEEHYQEAADAYDHAIRLLSSVDKKDWPLFFARGVSEERSHHWDAAERDLKQALKLNPDEPQVLNYLGYSWIDQGRNYPQAIAMLEKARTLKPFDGYIVDSVGWAYFRLGRYQDAVKTLEDAVLLVPADPTINDHLGDAYWKVGRRLDAQFQWNHALAFNPSADQKAKIEQKLRSGLQ